MTSITLSEAEIQAITGYVQPASQLAELLRRGFDRARRSSRTGMVIVERAHYDAVCAGTREARAPEILLAAAAHYGVQVGMGTVVTPQDGDQDDDEDEPA